MSSQRNTAARSWRPAWAVALSLVLFAAVSGCSGQDAAAPATGSRKQAVCNAGNAGGDLNCPCTDNPQCTGYDDDTRVVICNVATGATVGACFDCNVAGARPVGCFCDADADCSAPAKCNGRTCQELRNRGDFCLFDGDCGTDATGAMTCLPTKSFCGPLDNDFFCDFASDCLSGICSSLGVCTAGQGNAGCTKDADCTAPLICSTITGACQNPGVAGDRCTRNAECTGMPCNSFNGVCQVGDEGVQCTTTGNSAGADGDCSAGLLCTNCSGGFNCRPSGSNCP